MENAFFAGASNIWFNDAPTFHYVAGDLHITESYTASSVEYSPSPSQSCNSNNMSTRYAVERESTSHLEETRRARMRRFQNHNGHDDPRHSESAQHTSTCIDDINGSRNPFQPFLPTPNTQSRSGRGGHNTITSPNQDVPRSTPQRQHGNPRTFRRFENASNFSVNVDGREIPNFVGDVYEYSGRPNSARCEPRSEFPSHTSSSSAERRRFRRRERDGQGCNDAYTFDDFIAAAEGGPTSTSQCVRPSRNPVFTDFTIVHNDDSGEVTSSFTSRGVHRNPQSFYNDHGRNREHFQGQNGTSSYPQPVPTNPIRHSRSTRSTNMQFVDSNVEFFPGAHDFTLNGVHCSTTGGRPRRTENDSEYPTQTRSMPPPPPTYEERISDVLVQSPPSYDEVWEQTQCY
ncbi:hypothetical protein BT96DRAFT_1017858 [Gymnopus androsaceus JB14]|uniref:Uncharacterized protein n=1 Tax=Gymnopus androsaceus JB14 TaxID=1447944 RepID=A0A6A4HVW1_9AGAR|nr:hypothetical protein BT96DRAFT_1017858 [Gymnopus androsaceus JB14]